MRGEEVEAAMEPRSDLEEEKERGEEGNEARGEIREEVAAVDLLGIASANMGGTGETSGRRRSKDKWRL